MLLSAHRPVEAQSFTIASEPPASTAPTLVPCINAFGWDLYRQLANQQQTGSFVCCPPSLFLATAALGIGSSGTTSDQLTQALRLDNWSIDTELASLLAVLTSDPAQLTVASRLFLQHPAGFQPLPSYRDRLARSFQTGVAQIDFRSDADAAQTVDAFLAQNDFDQQLGGAVVTPKTQMLMANVVRARSTWNVPFAPELTQPLPFHGSRGPVEMPFMYDDARWNRYAQTDHAQIVEIPGGPLSLVILLPRAGSSLKEFEASLTAYSFAETFARLPRWRQIQVRLPRFKVESKLDGRRLLQSLGAAQAFSPDADFSGITGDRNLRLDKVVQVATLAVDEVGAEAQAATVAECVPVSRSAPVVFQADRPFLFALIRHADPDRKGDSPLCLFLGRFAP